MRGNGNDITITTKDLLAKCVTLFFFCKCMLYESSPEILDAKGVILRQGDTMNGSIALQVKTVTWPLWNPHNFQKAKK